MFIHFAPFWLRAVYPNFVWRMPDREKVLYLTFDDGPVPEITDSVLETLAKFKAQATFFCIGDNVRKHKTLFATIKSSAHSIGNHTYHHLNGWKSKDEKYLNDAEEGANALGLSTPLFRPPYGRIKYSQARVLSRSHRIIMWDVLSGDFSQAVSQEQCLRKTIRYVRPGSIVVFHDSLKASKNMAYTLPRFIEHFGSLGYTFLPLPMHYAAYE